ncbi:polysaccharide pyruvyl transferase family protein [Brachybacterium sp. J153]|uniref:polysaccharide pyruvyl transferase family protein n=1 Tax=Brachybacterium sp. J153 TaxID=3116488 RepID=UPI002E76AC85|nr:polysaccharide pyruvyl transferase family protein [Brachybacterium sp. J153]MEE1617829.1 polysaccharide pyruvyl transferase family protein [Brachybacterium sp. J153]
MYENRDSRRTEAPLAVLGSGLMYPQVDLQEVPYLKFYGVRGLYTRSCISRTDDFSIGIGDPGLLVADLFARYSGGGTTQLGVIPHVGFQSDRGILDRIKEARANGIDVRVLDIGTDDFAGFLDAMRDCRYILSQSLHGLIFADALGIPNIWWNDRLLNSRGGRFKFYDYFSSVDRTPRLQLNAASPLDTQALKDESFILDEKTLAATIRDIRRYHEKALKVMGGEPREKSSAG